MIDTPYQFKSLASRVRGMHGALDADELAKLLGVAKVNVSSECSSSEPLRPAREPARKVQQSRPGHRPLAAFEVITEDQHGASLALLCSFLDLGARCVPD
jgi:hypothetical protein